MKKILFWIQALRPQFFAASLFPALIGIRMATAAGKPDITLAVLTIVGVLLAHGATNVANDYYDHCSGVDEGDTTSGSRVIQEGKITPGEMRQCFIMLYLFCAVVGAVITWSAGWPALLFGIMGFAISFYYVGPPLRLEYRGMGEIAAGVGMGPVIVLGAYYVQTGNLGMKPFLVSLPVGLLVAGILYVQSLADREHDRKSGKNTLVARLRPVHAAAGVGILWGMVYGITLLLRLGGMLSRHIHWLYLTIPAALYMACSAFMKRDNLERTELEGKVMVLLYCYCVLLYLVAAT